MDNREALSILLNKECRINKKLLALSDINISNQKIDDYSNSFHNYIHNLQQKNNADYIQQFIRNKLWDLFRINPLIAMKIMERRAINPSEIEYIFKIILIALKGRSHQYGFRNDIILGRFKNQYLVLVIEASFQNSVIDCQTYNAEFLDLALFLNKKEHYKRRANKYLNKFYIKHIIMHIPINRQIDLINWFWDRHVYVVKHYPCIDSFCGRKVETIIDILNEGSIWQHFENTNELELSERELYLYNKEKEAVRHFIMSVIEERNHLCFIKRILGEHDFDRKLTMIVGEDVKESYYTFLNLSN